MLARHATKQERQRLYEALVAIDRPEQAEAFLTDICTVQEVNEMAQRLEVARLLGAGESYASIQALTGASPTTIARVSKSLNYGPGGYRLVLEGRG